MRYALAVGVVAIVVVTWMQVPNGTQVDREAEADALAAELVRVMSVLEIHPTEYEFISYEDFCGWIPYEGSPFAGTQTMLTVSSDKNLELDRILEEVPNGRIERYSVHFSWVETPMGRFWASGDYGHGFSFGASTDCYGS